MSFDTSRRGRSGCVWASARSRTRAICTALPVLVLAILAAAPAQAEGWGLGVEIGPIMAAAGGTPFVFRVTPARMLSEEFSLGTSFYLTPAGDAQMYSGAFLAQFHVPADRFRVSPFFGFGVSHRRSADDDDTSIFFPMGASGGYRVGETLYLLSTLSLNLHPSIELEGEEDNASLGWTFGIGYRP